MNEKLDYQEYFAKLLSFLEEYRWLIDFAVTDILVSDVFSKIPSDWLHFFQEMTFDDAVLLSHESFKSEPPKSLTDFFEQCNNLKLETFVNVVEDDWPKCSIDKELKRGLSPKKQCEVENLCGLIDSVCKQSNCQGVIDIGSGLGYLDRLLASKDYHVLGIERNEVLVRRATSQVEKLSGNLSTKITFCPLTLDEKSTLPLLHTVESFKKNTSLKSGLCIVGLHTCGDLASSALKMFLNIPLISVAVIIPCCYHKMSLVSDELLESDLCHEQTMGSNFKNFPLSTTLCSLLVKPVYKEIFSRPFLRLASQENYFRWKGWNRFDHERNAFNVMSRAILQLYAKKEGIQLKRSYRTVLNKAISADFSLFIDAAQNCLISPEILSNCELSNYKAKISTDLFNLWTEYKDLMVLAEIILILQMSMQSLVEAFIIMDFLSYLKENKIENVKVARLCDGKISPRNFALIGFKTKS